MRSGAFCIGMELFTRLGLGRLASTRPRSHPQNPLLNSCVAKDGRWFWLIGDLALHLDPPRGLVLHAVATDPAAHVALDAGPA